MNEVQAKAKEIAGRYVEFAQERCVKAGVALSPRQEAIIRGAIMNYIEPEIRQRLSDFVTALQDGAKRIEELQQMDTDDLADHLLETIWSTLDEGTEESAVVEVAAERLRLLAG